MQSSMTAGVKELRLDKGGSMAHQGSLSQEALRVALAYYLADPETPIKCPCAAHDSFCEVLLTHQ